MTSLRVRLVESPKIAQEGQGPSYAEVSQFSRICHAGVARARKKMKVRLLYAFRSGIFPPPLGEGYSSVKVTEVLVVPFRGLNFWIGTA